MDLMLWNVSVNCYNKVFPCTPRPTPSPAPGEFAVAGFSTPAAKTRSGAYTLDLNFDNSILPQSAQVYADEVCTFVQMNEKAACNPNVMLLVMRLFFRVSRHIDPIPGSLVNFRAHDCRTFCM